MKLPQESSVHYPILLFVVMLGLATRVNPKVLEGMGRNSVWFVFLCLLFVFLGIWISLKINKMNENSVLLPVEKKKFSFLGRFIFLVYAAFFIGISAIYNYISGDFLSRALLYGEPKTYTIIETILATLAGLYPLKTHARYSHIMMIFTVPFFFIIFLSPLLNARWYWLKPIFNRREIVAPVQSLAAVFPIFSPLAAIVLMRKGKEDINGFSMTFLTAVIALLTALILAMGIATFGLIRAKEMIYFVYNTINAVRIENFVLERIVFIWMLYWKYIEIVGGAFFIRCAARASAAIFGKSTSAMFVLIAGCLSGILVWQLKTANSIFHLVAWMGYFTFFILVLMPVILLMMMRARRAAR